MRRKPVIIGVTLVVCLVARLSLMTLGEDKPDEWQEVKMQYSADWTTLKDIITPASEFTEITDNFITLPNEYNSDGFRCVSEKGVAKVDINGDGEPEVSLKKAENLVEYKIKYKDGTKSSYQLRVWQQGTKGSGIDKVPLWYYQRGCFRRGQVAGETIFLIDDNTNGFYNDYGADAICIGSHPKFAGLLSQKIIIKDKPYELKVDETGMKIWLKEDKSPTGKVNLKKGLNFPKQSAGMVTLKSGDTFITIFPKDTANIIPTGDYELATALITKRVRARKGSLPNITVEENKETVVKWGGPFKLGLKPRVEQKGTTITFIPPATLKAPQRIFNELDCPFIKFEHPETVTGVNGEEYFSPPGFKDPKGFCLPDAIDSYNITIIAKEPAAGVKDPKGKVIFKDIWKQWDPSGLVDKQPLIWDTLYQCPLYEYRGIATLKVTTATPVFGELTYEEDFNIEKK